MCRPNVAGDLGGDLLFLLAVWGFEGCSVVSDAVVRLCDGVVVWGRDGRAMSCHVFFNLQEVQGCSISWYGGRTCMGGLSVGKVLGVIVWEVLEGFGKLVCGLRFCCGEDLVGLVFNIRTLGARACMC